MVYNGENTICCIVEKYFNFLKGQRSIIQGTITHALMIPPSLKILNSFMSCKRLQLSYNFI
jgi:hypothetical protein